MTFLDEAAKVINGSRAEDYGSAEKNFKRIADMWSAILGHPVSVEEFAQCMIAVKLGRLSNSPDHRDSWVDIAGYVGCIGQIHDERSKRIVHRTDEVNDPEVMRDMARRLSGESEKPDQK